MSGLDRSLPALLSWVRDGESFVAEQVGRLHDRELREPSRLPGWSRAHVVTHLARNADALGNLFEWARTGIETPMYPSMEARDRAIEEGATRSGDALRADLATAAQALEDTMDGLPADAWSNEVRTRQGRAIPATEIVWLRVREVWIHAVDLGAGASFSDLPRTVSVALLEEVTGNMGASTDCPDLVLRADDGPEAWRAGAGTRPVTVAGTVSSLLGWVLGRAPGDELTSDDPHGKLPALPPWI